MIEKWEKLPEWVRWVLFIPVSGIISFPICILINFIPRIVPDLHYAFFFLGAYVWDLFDPMVKSCVSLGALLLFMPRGKIITGYILVFARLIIGIIILAGIVFFAAKGDYYGQMISEWDNSGWMLTGGVAFGKNVTFYGDIVRELIVFIGTFRVVGWIKEEIDRV